MSRLIYTAELKKYTSGVSLFYAIVLLTSCNPFSPEIDNTLSQNSFGDPHTVNGFFDAFRSAYQFRDTTFYGKLLAPNFIFSYRNYDRGLDLEWGRDEEMQTTGSLFGSAQSLDLLWGNVLDSSGTETAYDITRSFSRYCFKSW